MALPMPVASSTQPSSTKIGTETSTMLAMPSSMRPTMTISGTVLREREEAITPQPKQNAIGTPATRHSATRPARKIRMFSRPSCASCGASQVHRPTKAATPDDGDHEVRLRHRAQRVDRDDGQHQHQARRRWPRPARRRECRAPAR